MTTGFDEGDAPRAGDGTTTPATTPSERLPHRVQRQRTRGWRMPPNTVYVGRPGKWGNPFNFRPSEYCWAALSYGCRGDLRGRLEASVRAFRQWIDPGFGRRSLMHEEQPKLGSGDKWIDLGPKITAGEAPSLDDIRRELAGKDLACWCPLNQSCHADVLLELANAQCEGLAGGVVEATGIGASHQRNIP